MGFLSPAVGMDAGVAALARAADATTPDTGALLQTTQGTATSAEIQWLSVTIDDSPRVWAKEFRLIVQVAVQLTCPAPSCRPAAARAWPLVARMKRSAIRDRGGAAAYPRHSRPGVGLPRFNAEQTPDPGFRDAASGLRQATPGFHEAG